MKKLSFLFLLAAAIPAFADRMPLPADTPASFRNECGSCHLAYPPALLAAIDWQRTMAGLKDHFGSDASAGTQAEKEIADFLLRHAGSANKLGSAGSPPRISQTERFMRKHREVPARYWRDPRVKSAANCEACHRDAANGRFSEHDIAIAELRR